MAITRRERANYFRWIQYAIGIAILIVIAFLADWSAFAKAFLNIDVALEMFPEVVTTGLKNTLIYTVLAFIFGLVFGVIIACRPCGSTGYSGARTSSWSVVCPHCSCCSWSPSASPGPFPDSSSRAASTAR